MQKLLIPSLFICLFSLPSFAYRQGTKDTSIHNECRWNEKELGYSGIDCNDIFNHYPPKKSTSTFKNHKNNVRLGSYNILWSEDEAIDKKSGDPKKDYELNVEMMNDQWDVVALQELQYGSNDGIKAGNTPKYIEILKMLQEKDDSWGLIISPFGQSTKRELLGFYYRGSVAQPVESKYCKENFISNEPYYLKKDGFIYREVNEKGTKSSASKPITNREFKTPKKALGCPLAFSQVVSENFPKLPFMARFKSGEFEFSYVSLHLGFRGLEEFDSECMGVCQLRNIKLISFMDGDENNDISHAIDVLAEKESTKKLFRGTEVALKKPKQITDNSYVKNLGKSLFRIHKNGHLPKSCMTVESNCNDGEHSCFSDFFQHQSAKLLSKMSDYARCFDDFESSRDEAIDKLAKSVFDDIVFNGSIKRINQRPDETKQQFVERVFSGKSIASGLYNVIGADYVVSKEAEGRQFPRLFQVNSVLIEAQKMKEIESSNDVIVAGDFNLEVETNPERYQYHVWKEALSRFDGAELLIKGKTSLNDEQELANNYDHFIMSPSATNECDKDSAEILDFLTTTLNNGIDLGDKVKDHRFPFVLSDHLPIGITCSAK